MDYTLNLDPELDKELMKNIEQYEEKIGMPNYVTSAERIGIEKGMEKGEL